MDLKNLKDFLPAKALNNLLEPASYAIGNTVGGLLYFIFQKPIEYGIIKRNEFDRLANEVTQKTAEIPEKNRDTSKSGLALKALEESKYQLNQDNLRNMFAQLVASSLDNRKNNIITPRFATILSQLSHEDAVFLKLLSERKDLLYGYFIKRDIEYGPYSKITLPLYWNGPKLNSFSPIPQASIDVLSSLGVVIQREDEYPAGSEVDKEYRKIEDMLQGFADAYKANSNSSDIIIEFNHGHVKLTDFGTNFVRCIL